MKLLELKDRNIALIVWNTQKKDDVHVYLVKLQVENDEACLINEENGWRVALNREQLHHLQPVSDDLKDTLLNADYALSINIEDLPVPDSGDYLKTGMKWHDR